jgi:hypothetical protein
MGCRLSGLGAAVLPEGVLTMLDDVQVPAEPVYTITLTPGGAVLDGEPIRPEEGQDDQMAALAEITTRAARRGRPVRVTAHDSAGTTWLIVHPDGAVEKLTTPHGPPAPHLPPPPVPFGRQSPPAPSPPASPVPAPPAPVNAVEPRPDPQTGGDSRASVLPEPHGEHVRQMHAAEERGDFAQAIAFADRLEAGLTQAYGSDHTWVVHAATFRAWLLLRLGGPWQLAVEVAVDTTFRRYRTDASPREDTVRMARNAFAAWCRLAEEDPDTATALATRVQQALDLVHADDAAEELRARAEQIRADT